MRAVLTAAIAIVLAGAPAAAAQDGTQQAVDRAAQALRTESVYVDPAARDLLPPAEAAQLRDRIAEGDAGEVLVAVLPEGAVPSGAEAGELADRVGREGSYAILSGDDLWTGGTSGTAEAREQARAGADNPPELLTGFVDALAEDEDEDEDAGGAGALVLLGLAGAGGAGLLVARRRRRQRRAVAFAEVRENVRDDLVALGDDIRALDLEMELPGASAEAREDYGHAVAAYDRANGTWELARTPEDLEPVGAALEEGRWAMASSKARLEGREPPERRSPCFFDPRHGPSDRDVEWAPLYGEPRMVPACEADARRVERGDDPEAREVLVDGRRTPYWNAGPMYAPFAGGFFGGGLLPGLMIGTMMGSSMGWGAGAAYGDVGGGSDAGGFGGGDFGGFGGGGGDFGG